MASFSYERLSRIANSAPPYRGTTDRFPLYTRRENTKYFFARQENGQTVFDLIYGNRWENIRITKEQYDAFPPRKQNETIVNSDGSHIHYVRKVNRMATVYPGDTTASYGDGVLEFNAKSYGQGENRFLSDGVQGWFSTESRRGGMTYNYRVGGKRQTHPIYRGMRVNARTMEPIESYEVLVNRVDRKASKELMKRYEHFLTVSEVMLKSMTLENVVLVASQLVEGSPRKYGVDEEMLNKSNQLMNTAPLDAFLFYTMGHDLRQLKYMARTNDTTRWWYGEKESNAYDRLYSATKRRLIRDLYERNPGIFKPKSYASGEKYPSCIWGTTIMVNGKQVEQYE